MEASRIVEILTRNLNELRSKSSELESRLNSIDRRRRDEKDDVRLWNGESLESKALRSFEKIDLEYDRVHREHVKILNEIKSIERELSEAKQKESRDAFPRQGTFRR